ALLDGDLVRIGDYGVALRPDEIPLDTPLPRTAVPEPLPGARGDVLADTAPHPLVVSVVDADELVAEVAAPARRSRRVLGLAILVLVAGRGGALLPRGREGDARRARSPAPPPPTPEVVAEPSEPPPPSPEEPPPLELTPPTMPASRPSTATEWMAAARSAA